MSVFIGLALSFLLALFLFGCNDDSSQEQVKEPKPTELQGVIPEHQLHVLEKAKSVEGVLQEVDGARRQSIENNDR